MDQNVITNENKYQFILENANDLIAILNERLEYEYINETVHRKLMGYTSQDLIGKTSLNLIHPDDYEKAVEVWREGFIQGEGAAEIRLKDKAGNYHWLEIRGRTFVDTDGKKKGLVVSRDITERKIAEQELRLQSVIMTNLSEGVHLIRMDDGIIVYTNPRFEEIFGYDPGELIGKHISIVNAPTDKSPEETAKEIIQILEATGEWHGEVNNIKKDGTLFWCYANVSAFDHPVYGKVTVAIHTDITERKEVELKLKESEQILQERIKELQCLYGISKLNEKSEISINEIIQGTLDLIPPAWQFPELICARIKFKNNEYKTINFKETKCKLFTSVNINEKIIEMEVYYLEDKPFLKEESNLLEEIGIRLKIITEQREAEQKLKESEKKYRNERDNLTNIMNSMEDGVYIANQQYDIEFVNLSLMEEFGPYEGKKCYTYFHDLFEVCPWCKIQDVFKGKTVRWEWYSSKNQKTYDLIDTPLKNPDGSLSKLEIFRDITEHKKAELKLKESEEKYKNLSSEMEMILDHIPALVFYKDTENNFIRVNQIVADAHNMSKEELTGRNLFDLYSKENAQAYWDDDLAVIRSDNPKLNIEEPWDTIEGRKWVSTSKIPFVDENGKITGIVGFSSDITERKKAEQKLKESEEKFRKITEQSLMGIAILQNDVFKYVNQQYGDIFGYTIKELNSFQPGEFIKMVHPKDRDMVREQALKKQEGFEDVINQYQFRGIKETGETIWIENLSKTILYDGKPADLITIIDIDEKKKAEEELKRLNKLKAELLTRASHELKTPLMSIKGFTELLLLKYKEILYEDELYLVNEICKGCFRLETLVEDILKTAELESGTIQLEKSEEDLSLIIRACVNELKGFADSRNQNINLMLHGKLETHLERKQILQAINNLLNNAIKYTPPNGNIEICSEIKEDFFIISIKDSGIGFNEEEKRRIFKRFGKIERYGQGYNVVSEGSGLGLYISRKILELHGGEIWVESEGRSKGSTFYFSLPITTK